MIEPIKPWAERSNTIGFIPGKKQNRRDALRAIFAQFPAASGSFLKVTMASGKDASIPVDEICVRQFSRGALVQRESNGQWVLAEAADSWLRDQNDTELAVHLHSNVKLFGELLSRVEDARTNGDLLGVAAEYGLTWTSTDQLNRRIAWMELLSLVERWGGTKLVITANGREFLMRVQLATAEEATASPISASSDDAVLPPPGEIITALKARHSYERKVIIGYIPRGRKAPDRDSTSPLSQSPFDAIRTLVALVGDGVGTEEYLKRCLEQLGLKRTSATQTMHTMRQMAVFDMVAFNQYGPSPDVIELLEPGNEVDFIRHLHARYHFVGELLTLLDDATPVPEVARVAAERYGFTQIDNAEVRTRMGFFVEAGLVERIDWTRYSPREEVVGGTRA